MQVAKHCQILTTFQQPWWHLKNKYLQQVDDIVPEFQYGEIQFLKFHEVERIRGWGSAKEHPREHRFWGSDSLSCQAWIIFAWTAWRRLSEQAAAGRNARRMDRIHPKLRQLREHYVTEGHTLLDHSKPGFPAKQLKCSRGTGLEDFGYQHLNTCLFSIQWQTCICR